MGILPLHELAQPFSVTMACEEEFCQMGVFSPGDIFILPLGHDCLFS